MRHRVRHGPPVDGFVRALACDGRPPLNDLLDRYAAAGGRYIACGVCVKSKGVDPAPLLGNAEVGGTVQFWEWIGDGATTFSF